MRFILTCLIAASAALGSAIASEEAGEAAVRGGWTVEPFRESVEYLGAQNRPDFEIEGVMVWTAATDESGVVFRCSDQFGLQATLTTEPIDISENLKMQTRLAEQRRATPEIEWRDPVRTKLIQMRRLKTMTSTTAKDAAMIFNAVLDGARITLTDGPRSITAVNPPPVDEAFETFAIGCLATNPSRKD